MCEPGRPSGGAGNYLLEVTPDEKERFEKALTDWLTGTEPDFRVMREMNVRLRRATRKRGLALQEEI